MRKKERILLILCLVLVMIGMFSCSLTPLEAGLAGAVAGTAGTLILDDEPDIITGDGAQIVQESPDSAYGLLAVIVENAWALAFLALVLWLLPSPREIIRKLKRFKHE